MLLPNIGLDCNLNKNSFFWPSDNKEDNIGDVKDLGSQQLSHYLDPSLSESKKLAYCSNISVFLSHQNGNLWKKLIVPDQLTNRLKKGELKNMRKKEHLI